MTRGDAAPAPSGPPERRHRRLARRLGLLLGIVAAYVLLAKAGLAFASITPGVSPISPASGLALAAVILWGRRVWPAIFAGAWLATLATAGAAPALAIAGGNTLEALLTGRLLARWSGGAGTFADAGGVVRFAAICLLSGPVVGATVNTLALNLAGLAAWADVAALWATLWLGATAGALIVTPAVVLTVDESAARREREALLQSLLSCAGGALVGFIAFGPPLRPVVGEAPLALLAVLPLAWAAGRGRPHDTAALSLILSGFAVWGTLARAGSLAEPTLNQSFLALLPCLISAAVPSLALSAEIARRHRAERRLRRQRRDLQALIGEARVGIADLDAEARFRTVNGRFAEIVRRPPGQLAGASLHDLVVAAERPQSVASFERMRRTGTGYLAEHRCPLPDGTVRWLRAHVGPILDAEGRLRRAVLVCEDVTARHEAEDRRKLLAAEADHRLRNIFATILSIGRLTLPGPATKEVYAEALEARVAAIARMHDLLTRQAWSGAPLGRILADALHAYAGDGETIRIAGPDCTLAPKQALDMALVVHELATNAARHGALSAPGGRLAVDWDIADADGRRRLILRWRESGGPPVQPPPRKGFGTRLIESALAGYDAAVELSFPPEGVRCRIEVAIEASPDHGRTA